MPYFWNIIIAMNKVVQFCHTACSYIFPWLVAKRTDGVSPLLEVWLIDGTYQLNTRNANYSFGSLHTVFKYVFDLHKVADLGIENALLLGFGTGSVAHILQEEYHLNCGITGIDIDPVVLELGYKYFNVSKYRNLNLICTDASVFMNLNTEKFDLIVVDLFLDLEVPAIFSQTDFLLTLKNALSRDGILFFNKIPYTTASEKETLALEMGLKQVFKSVVTEKITLPNTGNWVFVCKP